MSHFNIKSLAFYGATIFAVLVLFNVVTAYGEANLKAPPAIGGRYRISAKNLPDCLKSQSLKLIVQQSGIYLSGSLLPVDKNAQPETNTEAKPSLAGQWENEELNLSGAVPQLNTCNQADTSVNIQGRVQGKNLAGTMTLSSIPGKIDFTAQREEPVQQQKKEH